MAWLSEWNPAKVTNWNLYPILPISCWKVAMVASSKCRFQLNDGEQLYANSLPAAPHQPVSLYQKHIKFTATQYWSSRRNCWLQQRRSHSSIKSRTHWHITLSVNANPCKTTIVHAATHGLQTQEVPISRSKVTWILGMNGICKLPSLLQRRSGCLHPQHVSVRSIC